MSTIAQCCSLAQDSHSMTFFKHFLKALWPIVIKFRVEPPGRRKQKIVQTVQVTWPTWPPFPYTVKSFKIIFSGTIGPMAMTLDICHWEINVSRYEWKQKLQMKELRINRHSSELNNMQIELSTNLSLHTDWPKIWKPCLSYSLGKRNGVCVFCVCARASVDRV